MPSSFTSSLRLELMADGENATTWGQRTNTNMQLLEQSIAGRLVKSLTGSSGNVTLTAANGATDESRNLVIEVIGLPTGDVSLIVPTASRRWTVFNNTSASAFNVTVKTSGGTGVVIPLGFKMDLYCDGTNVVESLTAISALRIASVDIKAGTIDGVTIDGGTF